MVERTAHADQPSVREALPYGSETSEQDVDAFAGDRASDVENVDPAAAASAKQRVGLPLRADIANRAKDRIHSIVNDERTLCGNDSAVD